MTAGAEHPSGAPGAVHDQKQLLRERVRVPSTRLLRKLAETTHDGSFVFDRRAVPRVVGLGELTGRPDERAPQALGPEASFATPSNTASSASRGSVCGAINPSIHASSCRFVRSRYTTIRSSLEEVPVQRHLGDAGLGDDRVHADRPVPIPVEQTLGRLQDPLPSRGHAGRPLLLLLHRTPSGRSVELTRYRPVFTIATLGSRQVCIEEGSRMRVGVMGTGTVGRVIGARFSELGHDVAIGTRDVDALLARTEPDQMGNEPFVSWSEQHPEVKVDTFAGAAASAELLVNATNGAGSLEAIGAAGEENLGGKVLIDIANPLDVSGGMPPSLFVSNTDSLGEQIQRAFPAVKVVKALNTMNAHVMADPSLVAGGEHTVFVSGNDERPRARSPRSCARSAGSTSWISGTSPRPGAPRCTCRCGSGSGGARERHVQRRGRGVIRRTQDRICLVTGATSGIGKATAQALAAMGSTTVLVARDPAKGETAANEIRRATGNDRVEVRIADLSSQASIRTLAGAFERTHDRLDVLVNCAGAFFRTRRLTIDGIEMTFELNHLAYFLVTNLFLDRLRRSHLPGS